WSTLSNGKAILIVRIRRSLILFSSMLVRPSMISNGNEYYNDYDDDDDNNNNNTPKATTMEEKLSRWFLTASRSRSTMRMKVMMWMVTLAAMAMVVVVAMEVMEVMVRLPRAKIGYGYTEPRNKGKMERHALQKIGLGKSSENPRNPRFRGFSEEF